MGVYATGFCTAEKRTRMLISGSDPKTDDIIHKNQRRREIKALSGQIARGTVAPHVYVKGEKPEGSDPKGPPPCATRVGDRPCHWQRASHPKAADLAEAWPQGEG
jgi:hypothetical protein